MTKSEVEGAIGMPAGDYRTNPGWDRNFTTTLAAAQTQVPSKQVRLEGGLWEYDSLLVRRRFDLWTWDDYWIEVLFDEQGKTLEYYLLKVTSPSTFFDRVQRWLGIS
jgi:hypothetical protein